MADDPKDEPPKTDAEPAAAPAKPEKEEPIDPVAAAAALADFERELSGEPPRPKAHAPAHVPAAGAEPPIVERERETPHKIQAGESPRLAPLGPKQTPPVVVFDKVTKSYGDFTAVKDVTFKIDDYPGRGEMVSILGPSGCGKSTVIRLIAGLTPQFPATSGTVQIFGKPVFGPGSDRGMVFQDYTSFDNRTVLENVAFGLECRGVGKKEREDRARVWINKVGLSFKKDADKYPHQLSGGMRQRVAIARTLILEPKIILMDEPFGALDPPTRSRMQDTLIELWRESSPTVFFITHSIEEAVYLGDNVLIFSSSPGTVLKEYRIDPPTRPSLEMQRDPKFLETVWEIRELIEHMESSSRAGDLPMAERKKAGWFQYVKAAFTYRWNMLIFGGALAAAAIPGSPDIVIPLVAAGEVAYLAGLTTLPRFQAAIDARSRTGGLAGVGRSNVAPEESEKDARAKLLEVLNSIEPDRRNRFLRLRARCVEMQRIANAVRGDTRDASGASQELRAPALDRLLWMFVRLLLAQQAIERFLKATDGAVLKKNLLNLEEREKAAAGKGDERIERSLKDAMSTAQMRLENYAKAESNFEFVGLELDRIEQKIQALAEMAVSHENPDELSVQVDAVADGMAQTEQTIRELQSITGLGKDDEATPSILGGDMTEAIKQ